MDPRITLNDIITWEALRKKSFMRFNSGEIDDITTLMYVHDHSNKREYTQDFYCKFLRKKIEEGNPPKELHKFLKMVEQDLKYVNQFSSNDKKEEGHDMEEPSFMTPMINAILFSGINPQWFLCQGLDILPILSQGYEEKMQRDMENQRFWAMLLVSPHIKSSAFDKLKRDLTFGWEKAKAGLDKITQSDINLAHAIFGKK